MNTYFLCITQPYNLGDLIINKMLIDELCKYGKVYVDIYKTPTDFASYLLENKNAIDVYRQYGITVKRLKLWSLRKLIKEEKINAYTSSPGPLSKPGFVLGTVLNIIKRTFVSQGVDAYSIGQCGSMMLYKQEILKISKMKHMYLRSYKSVEYVNKYNPRLASYIPDLAFLFRQYASLKLAENRICMTFRDLATPMFKEKCIQVINDCAKNGYEVELFYQVKTDRPFMDDLYASVNHPNVHYRSQLLWFDDLSFYSGSSCVISNRLHALLMGMVYNAIPIAFVQNQSKTIKIRDVFESVFGEVQMHRYYFNYETDVDIIETLSKATCQKAWVNTVVQELCTECCNTIQLLSDSYQ